MASEGAEGFRGEAADLVLFVGEALRDRRDRRRSVVADFVESRHRDDTHVDALVEEELLETLHDAFPERYERIFGSVGNVRVADEPEVVVEGCLGIRAEVSERQHRCLSDLRVFVRQRSPQDGNHRVLLARDLAECHARLEAHQE